MNNLYASASASSASSVLGKRSVSEAPQGLNHGEEPENEVVNAPAISLMPTEFMATTSKYWVLIAQQVNALRQSIQNVTLGGPSILSSKGMIEGLVIDGKIVCKAKITVENGIYYGHFIHGELSGGLDSRLTMSPPEEAYQGINYVGALLDSLPHGVGTLYRADCSEAYSGGWFKGLPHGHGSETSLQGGKYVGHWNKGCREGEGTLFVTENVKAYEGNWLDNLFHGKGKIFYSDGRIKVEGIFAAGKMHGECTFYYPRGNKYVGGYKGGQRHGEGILHGTDGPKFRLVMNDGVEVSRTPYVEEAK